MKKVYAIYCKVEDIIAGIGFATIVILTFMNAVLRYLGTPIIYADDICLLLFSWTAFLGADVAMRYSRLVGMDILVSKFSPKVQKVFQIVVYVLMIMILFVLIRGGLAIIKTNGARPFNTLAAWGIRYGAVTASLPVGGLLMIITCLTKIYKVVTHFNDDAYNVRKDNPDMVGEEYTGADKTPVTFNDTKEVKQL
ncbi:MAG: TRAP transporter small permease [Acholeplasmataceae bacterium]|nr:TRAP transporter small permease [Acholeplasmataceae bacterium]